jgi:hypothetical protein
MLVVVLGPQTRLATALLNSTSWHPGTAFLLVTRSIPEYEAVKRKYPSMALYRSWDPDSRLLEENETVTVLCCAFGVIHPGSVEASGDLQKANAGYRTLEMLLRTYSGLPVHLVLISSVLALCPRPGREYYAGWKNVVEGLLRHIAATRRGVGLSVFYPGRLVEANTFGSPSSWLHTSYQQLAEEVVSHVQHKQSRAAIVGLDSSLWLAMRCLWLVWSALTHRR